MADLRDLISSFKGMYHGGIYNAEKAVTRALGIDPQLFTYASSRPSQFGFEDAPVGKRDYGDVMRHLLLSAELQRTSPMFAAPLLYGHEFISGVLHGQNPEARKMDLFNNALGMEIGKTAKSREQVELGALLTLPKAMALDPFSSPR